MLPNLSAPLRSPLDGITQNVKAEMTFDQWLELLARFAPPPSAKPAAAPAAKGGKGRASVTAAAPGAGAPVVRFQGLFKALDGYLEEAIYPTAQRIWPGRW